MRTFAQQPCKRANVFVAAWSRRILFAGTEEEETMSNDTHVTRRTAFASVAGIAAAAGLSGTANAAPSAEESANVQLVTAFMKAWGPQTPDPAKLASYLAEQCFVTLNPGPPAPIASRAAAQEAFKPFLADGTSFDLEILETKAKGPAVFMTRLDYSVKQGKRTAAEAVPAVALFVVKDGKIKSWHDYAFSKTA
jgi:limonene-1,2-epoxide hydrolase